MSPIIIPLLTAKKIGLRVFCLRAHSQVMARLGLDPRSWNQYLAPLPVAFGGTVSRDWDRSQDRTWAAPKSSMDQNLAVLSLKTHGKCLDGLKWCLVAAYRRCVFFFFK